MTSYLVSWAIDIDADSPEEAAERALEIQRDPAGLATVFKVYNPEQRYDTAVTMVDIGPLTGIPT